MKYSVNADLLLLNCILLFLSACGGLATQNQNHIFYPQPYLYLQTVPYTSEAQYRIQPGDSLDIKFFYNPELNEQAITVRPDGRISLQLIQEVIAAGLMPDELRNLLIEKYKATEFRDIEVIVQVKSFKSQRVFVDGEVYRPNLIALVGQMTVLQAIAQAGGLRDTARMDEVIIIRRGIDDKPIVTRKNLKQAIDGTDIAQNIPLMPYDMIFVPKSPVGNLDRWADQYIWKVLPFSLPPPIHPQKINN